MMSSSSSSSCRPRILYGSLFCWMSLTGGRFLAPFLEHECGCNAHQIGIVLACQYGIMGGLSPLLGHVADAWEAQTPHYGRGRVLMMGVIVGSLCFVAHGMARLPVLHAIPLFHQWWYHWIVHCGYATCFATMFPVLDGMTVDWLRRQSASGSDSTQYGQERMFGAVSWGVTNLLFGPLIDRFGQVAYYPCTILAAFYGVTTIVIFSKSQARVAEHTTTSTTSTLKSDEEEADDKATKSTASTTPLEEQANNHNNSQPSRPSTLSLVVLVFGTATGAAFGLCYFLLNTGFSVVENMVFLFFEFLGGSNTLMAVTVAITVSFEIPMFHLAPAVLRKYGTAWLLLLACAAFLIRVIGYTLIPQGQPYWVLLLEWLHGFTYAGAQSSAVEFVTSRMPRGLEASGQGLVNLVRGMASIVGLYAGGALQEALGPRDMYRVFVAAVTVGMVVLMLVQWQCPQQEEEERRPDRGGYETIPEALRTSENSRSNLMWDMDGSSILDAPRKNTRRLN